MADPTLNADDFGGGPASPVTGPGGVSGAGVIKPSQGMTKEDALVQACFGNMALLEALTSSGGSFSKNVLEYSEDLSGAGGWTASEATVAINELLSPTSWMTGTTLTENSATARHRNSSGAVPVTPYAPLAVSIYALPQTRGIVYLGVSDGGYGDFADMNFNLETGEITAGQLTGGLEILETAKIETVAGGWKRLSLVVVNTNQPSRNVYYGLCDATGEQSYTGDNASFAAFWGAQLEDQSPMVGTYKAVPLGQSGSVATFTPDKTARFVRDFAAGVMAVRALDLRDK